MDGGELDPVDEEDDLGYMEENEEDENDLAF